MALSKTTQDHDEIRQWAEARGGKPAEVSSTSTPNAPGILRIEFPGAKNADDSNLNEISWDDFFEKFDASGLSLVYQEVTAEGAESNFSRLVYPENVSASRKKSSTRGGTKKTAAGAKAATKKATKKAVAKTGAKKASATSSTKKAPAKNAPAKKAPAKTAPAKKAAAKTTPAKKASAKKTATKTSAKKTTKAGPQRAAVVIKKKAAAKKSSKR